MIFRDRESRLFLSAHRRANQLKDELALRSGDRRNAGKLIFQASDGVSAFDCRLLARLRPFLIFERWAKDLARTGPEGPEGIDVMDERIRTGMIRSTSASTAIIFCGSSPLSHGSVVQWLRHMVLKASM